MLSAGGTRFAGEFRTCLGWRPARLVAVTCLAMLAVGCGTAKYGADPGAPGAAATGTGTAVPSTGSTPSSSSSAAPASSPAASSPSSPTPSPTTVTGSPLPSGAPCQASQLTASQSAELGEGMGQTWERYQITNASGQACTVTVGFPTLAYINAAGGVAASFHAQGTLSTGKGALTVAPDGSVYFLADIHSGCWLSTVSGGPFQYAITLPGKGPTVIDSAASINVRSYEMCTSQYVTEGVLQSTPPPGPEASDSATPTGPQVSDSATSS